MCFRHTAFAQLANPLKGGDAKPPVFALQRFTAPGDR